jgi:4-methylaminobutanoate oxidase (formaldehyde-forming)
MGPRAREALGRATEADLGNERFPYGSVREIVVAGARLWAIRISYAGELGWELYVPVADAGPVYDALTAGGDVVNAGYYALDSLRIEKGYRAWGRELTPEETPLEAGMAFTVRFDKPGGFLGQAALAAQRARGLTRRLLLFALDDPEAIAWGDEPIYRRGAPVGTLTSAAYGHTLGRAVAMGYVTVAPGEPPAALLPGPYEIDIAGVRVRATASLRAWHDPAGDRLKG